MFPRPNNRKQIVVTEGSCFGERQESVITRIQVEQLHAIPSTRTRTVREYQLARRSNTESPQIRSPDSSVVESMSVCISAFPEPPGPVVIDCRSSSASLSCRRGPGNCSKLVTVGSDVSESWNTMWFRCNARIAHVGETTCAPGILRTWRIPGAQEMIAGLRGCDTGPDQTMPWASSIFRSACALSSTVCSCVFRTISADSGSSYGSSIPVKPLISPARAFL